MKLAPLLVVVGCIPPGDTEPEATVGEVALVRVQNGDCIGGIADRLSFPGGWRALASFNHLDGDRIRAGAGLRVPVDYLRAAGLDPRDMHLEPFTPPLERRALVTCHAQPVRGDCVTLAGTTACLDFGDPSDPTNGSGNDEPDGAIDFPEQPAASLVIQRGGTTSTFHLPNDHLLGELAGYQVDLDGDRRDEVVIAVPLALRNHLGFSLSRVFVIGDAGVTQLDVEQWGIGSLIESEAGCDLLATEWEDLDHPLEGEGMYLVGRPMRYDHGRLAPRGDEVVRRMRTYFHLDAEDEIERPGEWLADPRAEWWHELGPEQRAFDQHTGTIVSMTPIDGGVTVDVELVTGARVHLDPNAIRRRDGGTTDWQLSRFGWAANATLFPDTFIPAESWIGAHVVITDEDEMYPTHTVWIWR